MQHMLSFWSLSCTRTKNEQTAKNLSTLFLEGLPCFFIVVAWSGVWIDGKKVVQDVGYNMQAATVFVALELSLFSEAV